MKIFLTGSTGFIGGALKRKLISEGHELILPTRDDGFDLTRQIDFSKYPQDIDLIIHTAGITKGCRDQLFQVNADGTKQLAEYAKKVGVKRFVYFSSGSVYGGVNDRYFKESDIPNPISDYGQSKLKAERILDTYQIDPVIIRLFYSYGPGQKKGLIRYLIDQVKKRRAIIIYKEERPFINPIYIDDLVNICSFLINSKLKGKVFNVAGDTKISIRQLAEVIGEMTGKSPSFQISNLTERDLLGDNDLIKRVYHKPFINIRDGLKIMIQGE